jgi:hypothetical protein
MKTRSDIKKIKHFILLAFVLLTMSCERPWLEPWPPDAARTPSDIWSYYFYAKGFLDAVYSTNVFGPYANDISGSGMLASATDEAEHANSQGDVQNFTNGIWNPTNIPTFRYGSPWYGTYLRTPWDNAYLGIRRVNIFLENVDKSVIIDDVSDPTRQFDRTYSKGQAFYWRAWLQFDLLRKYGPFPILTKSIQEGEDPFIPRNTLDECFNQIIADCDSAIDRLPLLWDDNNWHRVNKTVAQTLKSRACLYYASPLYQGDFETYGSAANTIGDVERWKKAITATRDAINENSFYSLMPVTKFNRPYAAVNTYNNQVSLIRNLSQKEMIWGSGTTTQLSSWWERYNLPTGVEGCDGFTNPTQEMVDAFEVVPLTASTGKPVAGQPAVAFNWSNPVHAANPYANRDPRFYASINYNGSLWGNSSTKAYYVDTYTGGVHRNPLNPNSTKTGYYYRKWLSEDFYAYVTGSYSSASRSRIEFRFAELLLNYAEAMNEVYGPYGVDPAGPLRVTGSSAWDAINLIRARVAMPNLQTAGLTKDQMRDKIKHERQVELCFEGHRFYDLRRWKEGNKLGDPIHGVKITGSVFVNNRPTVFTYAVEPVEDRVWSDNMYWFPVPYSEIVKYEGKLKQNPGW